MSRSGAYNDTCIITKKKIMYFNSKYEIFILIDNKTFIVRNKHKTIIIYKIMYIHLVQLQLLLLFFFPKLV